MPSQLDRLQVPQPVAFMAHPGDPLLHFRTWIMAFESCLQLAQVEGNEQATDQLKNALLFSLSGTKGLGQFGSNSIIAMMNEAATTHMILQAAVPTFLQHPTSVPCACLDFCLRHQVASGSVSEFVVAPRELALDCQFSDDRFSEELAMQLIADCRSPMVWEWMLKPNLNLADEDEYLKILDRDEAVRVESTAFFDQSTTMVNETAVTAYLAALEARQSVLWYLFMFLPQRCSILALLEL